MKTENKISIASGAVATCALILTMWQACETRRHNRTSVRPQLIISAQMKENEAGLFLENIGIGPAIVRKCTFLYDGSEVTSAQVVKLIKSKLPLLWQHSFTVTKPGGGQGIPANSDGILIMGCKEKPSIPEYTHFLGLLRDFEILVQYESMYEEPFGIRYVQTEKPTITFTPTH